MEFCHTPSLLQRRSNLVVLFCGYNYSRAHPSGSDLLLALNLGRTLRDIFYSHRIPHAYIWIIYTLKTLTYMAAFFFMWLGEFYFGKKLSLAEPEHTLENRRIA